MFATEICAPPEVDPTMKLGYNFLLFEIAFPTVA